MTHDTTTGESAAAAALGVDRDGLADLLAALRAQPRVLLQHLGPCYELRYANGEPVDTGDGIPHYPTQATAQGEAASYLSGGWGAPAPHRLDAACVTLRCNRCRYVLDQDERITHFANLTEAAAYAAEDGWTLTPDGQALCSWCAPHRPRAEANDRQTRLPADHPGDGLDDLPEPATEPRSAR